MAILQTILVLLVSVSVAVSELKCYGCQGGGAMGSSPCADPINTTDPNVYPIFCGEQAYCIKSVYSNPNYVPAPTEYVTRHCMAISREGNYQPNHCYRRNYSHKAISTMCICDTDFCNGAATFDYPVVDLTV